MEARYYDKLTNNRVQCKLCPHNCIIASGKAGICKIRSNNDGILSSDMYGVLAATHFDPIEKKPLYHYYPGYEILSLGALGCNFHCSCCQNYEISQTGRAGFPRLQELTVREISKIAASHPGNLGIAYTYNEPLIWYEYMFDIAREIKKLNMQNVAVSNGYINVEPLEKILPYMDAFNIDLKAFNDKIYKEFAGGHLKHVLKNLEIIASKEKHLEITVLIVPGINDNMQEFEMMIEWMVNHLGRDVPLHLSRYFPRWKMKTGQTAISVLERFAEYAKNHLSYVYIGNIPNNEYQNTRCPNCGTMVIHREGYYTRFTALDKEGNCTNCGLKIAIV
jgi:pyruvate formate lyase activating enzyme